MIDFAPALPTDAPLIGQLRQRCWAATYRGIYPDAMIDQFDASWHAERDLARISSPHYDVRILRDNASPIGYMVIRHSEPPLLYSLYLLPEHQRRGIGSIAIGRMHQYCAAHGQDTFLCQCQPENAGAITFYRRMGGVIIARDEGNSESYMNSVTFRFPSRIALLTDADVLGTPGLSSAPPRLTARAVVLNPAGRIAVMYAARFNIHTLPGGGVEADESIEAALAREITEETGCTIASFEPLGYVEENRAHADYTQISFYYIVHTLDETLHPHLTAAEAANGTSAMWCTPDDAFRRISAPVFDRPQGRFLQARDVAALRAFFARKERL